MIGPQDIWVALALGIFFFGAKKLPELPPRRAGAERVQERGGGYGGRAYGPGGLGSPGRSRVGSAQTGR
jgi:hypothetical protein